MEKRLTYFAFLIAVVLTAALFAAKPQQQAIPLGYVGPTDDFDIKWSMKTPGAILGYELFYGLSDNMPTSPSNQIGFRFQPGVDASWRYVTANDDGSATVTDSTVDIEAATRYVLRVRRTGPTIEFSINGGNVFSHTTNVPTVMLMVEATENIELDYFSMSIAVER